jgi:hypothetical protein
MVATRRELLEFAVLGAFTVAVNPLEVLAQDKETDKKELISDEEIAKLMKRATVEDILKEEEKAGKIQYVKVNPDGTTNYDELVYQKNKRAEEIKPVLVLFYGGKSGDVNIDKRTAIITKVLAVRYNGKLSFVLHDATKDEYRTARREDVVSNPSTILYALWDRIKGESELKNKGNILQIDIAVGAPTKDSGINTRLRNSMNYWIEPLIFGTPNPEKDGKFYRFNNGQKLVEIASR